ncbi:hypothetical protein GCM10011579_033980 [Streptomyces albiflavescens]|uniref:Uncharacterized protein n=1 Tax=Streptomyces albiflavescens TaxID=1623582 RepID=A0A917Y3A4_9ACTN|nr:hypothetical protein GCM10011579_033980 [Streptomyces albiflavescens]
MWHRGRKVWPVAFPRGDGPEPLCASFVENLGRNSLTATPWLAPDQREASQNLAALEDLVRTYANEIQALTLANEELAADNRRLGQAVERASETASPLQHTAKRRRLHRCRR